MKTPRYKFDDVWKEAIRLMPYQSEEYTEMVIRGYIENGRDADTEFRETNFECAWLLIKAQIDARKERNLRARRKRMLRRELIVAERARRRTTPGRGGCRTHCSRGDCRRRP